MPRPSEYSYSVLQCNANNGTFCCRAGSDDANCCNTSAVFQAETTIGQILLPGTVETVNTTYSTVYDSGKSDKSAAVGGAVGGILGAALIASLIALFLSLRSRKALKTNYNTLQQERESAAQYSANEKAALQQQLDQQQLHYQQYQQQTQAPTYSAAHLPYAGYHSPALPMGSPSMHGYPSEISAVSRPAEMDTMRGASELSSETISQDVERIEENPKKVD
ncbi:hypothetical protein LTR67_009305 [Exophiala xenobiotica]|nr:hypothetical protein LTR14_009025 [Exophiala xenobiotica]KAK5474693.1 hypothetical protein LTR55_009621 [Exophiala xenobiotica]